MADRMLAKDDQNQLEQGFEKVENEIMGPGVHEKYHRMIEEWERKLH
jgi:hemerythrin-like domain-containing protein